MNIAISYLLLCSISHRLSAYGCFNKLLPDKHYALHHYSEDI